jgi:thiol-disulfide isomerase/thioredoxin
MRVRWRFPFVLALVILAAPLVAADLAPAARTLVMRDGDFAAARQLVEANRPPEPRVTADWLAAASWVARGASFARQWDVAGTYAQEVFDASVAMLAKRPLDADRDLPTALGASIEVLAHAYDAAGDRGSAVSFLRRQRESYRGTSIETRIQKNLLLLDLEGKPFPELAVDKHLGPAPRTTAELKGSVVLFFFWAHWCGDCKRQKPILEELYRDYAGQGLVIVGPTKLYGYIARGEDATAEQEFDYIANAYQQSHPLPEWMSVPVSNENFVNFGVSTTPTLVLVDRSGVVRMYHPGDMTRQELEERIQPLLGGDSD